MDRRVCRIRDVLRTAGTISGGGHVHGRDGVRDYWLRQWATIVPKVAPTRFSRSARGEVGVEVRQTVRERNGNPLSVRMASYLFSIENRLMKRFDARGP